MKDANSSRKPKVEESQGTMPTCIITWFLWNSPKYKVWKAVRNRSNVTKVVSTTCVPGQEFLVTHLDPLFSSLMQCEPNRTDFPFSVWTRPLPAYALTATLKFFNQALCSKDKQCQLGELPTCVWVLKCLKHCMTGLEWWGFFFFLLFLHFQIFSHFGLHNEDDQRSMNIVLIFPLHQHLLFWNTSSAQLSWVWKPTPRIQRTFVW